MFMTPAAEPAANVTSTNASHPRMAARRCAALHRAARAVTLSWLMARRYELRRRDASVLGRAAPAQIPWPAVGSPLVLIHGFVDCPQTWDLVRPALEQHHE